MAVEHVVMRSLVFTLDRSLLLKQMPRPRAGVSASGGQESIAEKNSKKHSCVGMSRCLRTDVTEQIRCLT